MPIKIMILTISIRIRELNSKDSLKVSELNNFLLSVGEGTESKDENQMIHIKLKFLTPWNYISDLSSVYGDIVNDYPEKTLTLLH